jgi:hypothetical protein
LPSVTAAPGVLADASEITGVPKDNFEVHEITREEYEEFRGDPSA